jgi:hypothetical protein
MGPRQAFHSMLVGRWTRSKRNKAASAYVGFMGMSRVSGTIVRRKRADRQQGLAAKLLGHQDCSNCGIRLGLMTARSRRVQVEAYAQR